MQLTRESIIGAAIDILDTYGLADMTMRRLAKHLDVVPGALYWHIPNKQSLIEAIAEEILTPVWQAIAVEKPSAQELCRVFRTAMNDHRDGAEVVSAALPVGDITPRITTGLIDALADKDLPADLAELTASTLINFCVGATLQEQSRRQLAVALDQEGTTEDQEERVFTAGLELIMSGALGKRSVEYLS
ncbi:TetR/AcrR family transcriptional regulator C-terminal domain-containing protein [Corynebacterium sp. H130]|uniref:TetR/AcrR family transcriptional regulator C-terminal domain-containing protein n=1 Tax=Corynebacterium sp. H130 TaxID=3133444 RepID=UPI0030A175AB